VPCEIYGLITHKAVLFIKEILYNGPYDSILQIHLKIWFAYFIENLPFDKKVNSQIKGYSYPCNRPWRPVAL
jgi:hypothetical protein